MSRMNRTICNTLDKLCELSASSDMVQKHAAAMLISGKPVSYGVNGIRGNTTVHAEYDAIRRYLAAKNLSVNQRWEKQPYILQVSS